MMSLTVTWSSSVYPHRPGFVLDRLDDLLDAAGPADAQEGQQLLSSVIAGGGVVQVVTHGRRSWPRRRGRPTSSGPVPHGPRGRAPPGSPRRRNHAAPA